MCYWWFGYLGRYKSMEDIGKIQIGAGNAIGLRSYNNIDVIMARNKNKEMGRVQETNWDKKIIVYVEGRWGKYVGIIEWKV